MVPVVEILEVFRDEQGAAVVKWRSENGRQYLLLAKDNLEDPGWQVIGGPIRSNGALTLLRDAGASSAMHRFYRVEVIP